MKRSEVFRSEHSKTRFVLFVFLSMYWHSIRLIFSVVQQMEFLEKLKEAKLEKKQILEEMVADKKRLEFKVFLFSLFFFSILIQLLFADTL